MKTPWDLVYVEWQDAEHDGTWSKPEDDVRHLLIVCQTIGWLIHRNKDVLVVASTINQIGHQIANKQYIPAKMARYIKVLKRGLRRGKRR